jgi:hypothetical protein
MCFVFDPFMQTVLPACNNCNCRGFRFIHTLRTMCPFVTIERIRPKKGDKLYGQLSLPIQLVPCFDLTFLVKKTPAPRVLPQISRKIGR